MNATAPVTHDPLVVSTQDGSSWMRRAITRDGHGLYALAGAVAGAPTEVLSTIPELAAEHGIRCMAAALPVPIGRELTEVERLQVQVAELEAQRDRRRGRLVALQNDALNMRGTLSPNGEDRKVPFALGETLTPAVEWLVNRVAELEYERHSTNEVLSDAAVALRERGTSPLAVYRTSHDSIVMGLYTTRDDARKHCETVLRRDIGDEVWIGWVPDHGGEDAPEELCFSEDVEASGYYVTPLDVLAKYDPDADE